MNASAMGLAETYTASSRGTQTLEVIFIPLLEVHSNRDDSENRLVGYSYGGAC